MRQKCAELKVYLREININFAGTKLFLKGLIMGVGKNSPHVEEILSKV